MEALRASPLARTLVIARRRAGAAPCRQRARFRCSRWRRRAISGQSRESAFLGVDEGDAPVFATVLDAAAADSDQGRADLVKIDLRSLAVQGLLSPRHARPCRQAQGKSLLFWHQRHRFCSVCGQPSAAAAAGWRRECTACGAQHFPPHDPVAIMLAVRGDRCVLGRQARFINGMYSCLAGFIEPGETMEDAVRRELSRRRACAHGARALPRLATLAFSGLADDRFAWRKPPRTNS